MNKIKIFEAETSEELENLVNDFLSTNTDRFVNFHYQVINSDVLPYSVCITFIAPVVITEVKELSVNA